MPSLPVVCITCRRVYREVPLTRPLRCPDEHADGVCPTCMVPLERRLFGAQLPVVGTIEPKYCGCGRQLITIRQHVEGRCECCAGETAVIDVEEIR